MVELKPYQKMLWKKAKDAGVTLPNDSETSNLSRPDIDRLVIALDRGEDVFGTPRAGSPSTAVYGSPGALGSDPSLIPVLTRIADALERIADRDGGTDSRGLG